MTTKEKIIASALLLFNTKGVEKVTTRHIANAIGISQGNLHYHYASKNVVIETLFTQFLSEVKHAERFKNDNFEKEVVIASMKDNFAIMYKYRFFFKDNEIVWRRLPRLKKQTVALFNLKKNQILEVIKLYKKQGIFREEISKEQINFLANQFILTIISWLSASEYMENKIDILDYYVQFTYRLWLPYLEEEEMKAWEKIVL